MKQSLSFNARVRSEQNFRPGMLGNTVGLEASSVLIGYLVEH